jgi:hypothetical protein
MKQTAILNMSVLLVLAAAANAQQRDEGKTCSNETLKGAYGGAISGTRPAPSVFPGVPGFPGQLEQAIGLILWVFDGKGGFTQIISGKGSLSGPGPEELRGLTTGLDRYHWCAGTLRAKPIPFSVVYLVGVPIERGPGITPSRSAVS